MLFSKLKSLFYLYKTSVQQHFFFKAYTPYLTQTKLKALKALGKEGYANDKQHTQKFLYDNNVSETRLTKLALYPLRQALTLKGTQEQFTGDLILKTVNNDVKVFSFEEAKVLNFINDKEKFIELKKLTDYFSQHFLTPIVEVNSKKQCFTEKLINYTPVEALTDRQHKQILESLTDSTINHIAILEPEKVSYTTAKVLFEKLEKNFANDPIVKRLASMVPKDHLHTSIPQIPCHGDPQKNNVLLDGSDTYFIDWEYAGQYVFYYDPVYMLIEPHIYRPDSIVAIEAFTESNLQQLQKLFNSFSLEVDYHNLPYYLSLVLMIRLCQAKTNGNSNIEYDLFCFNRFLDYFQSVY